MTEEESEYKDFSLTMPMEVSQSTVTIFSTLVEGESVETKIGGDYRAVALVGDKFYRGVFFPASELERVHKRWEHTLHDINHMGTSHIQGLTVTSDIRYFVGYNTDVSYNSESKKMSMGINIVDETVNSNAWKGYIKLCEVSGVVPNVSIHFKAKVKRVQAKDLPVNYTEYGLGAKDYVDYVYNVIPDALSTVYRGACNDSLGCGIEKCDCKDHSEEEIENNDHLETKEKQALIEWLKENDK